MYDENTTRMEQSELFDPNLSVLTAKNVASGLLILVLSQPPNKAGVR